MVREDEGDDNNNNNVVVQGRQCRCRRCLRYHVVKHARTRGQWRWWGSDDGE